MELFDMQEYARARHRDAMRSFRFAERTGLTRSDDARPAANRRLSRDRRPSAYSAPEWSTRLEG